MWDNDVNWGHRNVYRGLHNRQHLAYPSLPSYPLCPNALPALLPSRSRTISVQTWACTRTRSMHCIHVRSLVHSRVYESSAVSNRSHPSITICSGRPQCRRWASTHLKPRRPYIPSCLFLGAAGGQKKSRCVMGAQRRRSMGHQRSRGVQRGPRGGRLHLRPRHYSQEHTQHDITLPSRILLTGSITGPMATGGGGKKKKGLPVSQWRGSRDAVRWTSFLSPPPSTVVPCSSIHTNDSVYRVYRTHMLVSVPHPQSRMRVGRPSRTSNKLHKRSIKTAGQHKCGLRLFGYPLQGR